MRDGDYLVHLRNRIQAATGAARVVSDTSIIRLPDPDAFQVPVLNVHADYTDLSARQMLVESWDQGLGEADAAADLARLLAESIDAAPGAALYRQVLAINALAPDYRSRPHDLPLSRSARRIRSRARICASPNFREELVS